METFRIIFCRDGDDSETTTEFIESNDVEALKLFKIIEPFAIVIKIQQL